MAWGIRPANIAVLADEIVKIVMVALDVSGNDCLQEDIEKTEDEACFFTGVKCLDVRTPTILTGGRLFTDLYDGR